MVALACLRSGSSANVSGSVRFGFSRIPTSNFKPRAVITTNSSSATSSEAEGTSQKGPTFKKCPPFAAKMSRVVLKI